MATITIVPASGSVIATVSACRITASSADDNDAATFDADAVPSMDPIPYRLVASQTGTDSLVSHEFTVSADGDHVWDNVIFPTDGTWDVDLIDQRDDSVETTLAVTVTA
jgi:hypothetical protein